MALILSEGVGQGLSESQRSLGPGSWSAAVQVFHAPPLTPLWINLKLHPATIVAQCQGHQHLLPRSRTSWPKEHSLPSTLEYQPWAAGSGEDFYSRISPSAQLFGVTVASTQEAAGSLHLRAFPHSACMLSHFSRVPLFATLWTAAHQAPLFLGLSRQGYWSGLPCPPPGDLPNPGSDPRLLYLLYWQVGSLPLAPPGKPYIMHLSSTHFTRFWAKAYKMPLF